MKILEEDILNGFDEYITGWGMEYNQLLKS